MALSVLPQSPMVVEPPNNHCSQCAAFDLDDALRFNPGVPVRTVLKITRLKSETCSLCRFLSGSMGQVPEGAMCSLNAVQSHVAVTPLLEKIEAPILCIERRGEYSLFDLLGIRSSIIFDPDGPISQNLRAITPLIDDYTEVREWIASCVQKHKCHIPRILSGSKHDTKVRNLRVIDCRSRLVGKLPQSGSYVTLSYVWGKPDDQQAGVEPLEPDVLSSNLPKTIEDAIKVTLILGYDYLWVDRYCLGKSSEDFHRQLKQMDRIYAGSVLTIIAAAGSDGNYGLPGVSRRRKVNQPVHIGHRTLDSTPIFCSDTLESTTWSTRGWTYQEGLLPTRRLVFTDTQLYFECQERFRMEGWMAREDLFWRRGEESTGSWLDTFNEPDPGLFPTVQDHAMIVLDRIEAFSRRSLTYESDVLNAMLGIFASLEHSDRLKHIWGLPYCDSDPLRSDSTPLAISNQKFVSNLSWDVDFPARRRVDFPSWSWSGWAGTVRWARGLKMLFMMRQHRTTSKSSCAVKLELQSGKIIDWNTYQEVYSSSVNSTQIPSRYIHISAYITRIMPLPLPHSHVSRTYCLESDPESTRTGSALTYVDVMPTGKDFSSFLLQSYVLRLPWYLEYGHEQECHVLVVQCRGSHWERIGTGMTSIVFESAPVKKSWTEIRLG